MKQKLSVSLISMVVLLVISVILSGCGSDKTTAESKTTFDACIDAPASGATISSANYKVQGWFLDTAGVSKVEIQIDGTTVGEATYGDSRPDVQKAYPDYNNTNSGFNYSLDITALTNGSHSLTALETNSAGKTSSKKVSFTIAKSPEALVIGKWTSGEDSMKFNPKGEVSIVNNGEQKQYTYKLAAIAGSKNSTTISITESDGTSSSETAVFKDENTMVIGDTTLKRVIANAANAKADTESESGSPVASSNEAVKVVKKLLGSGNGKYIFELDHEDKVIKDDKGDFYTNRDNTSESNGIDCFIIRVYTEVSKDDSTTQDNIGWYYVSKSTGKVFELKDPYDKKLKLLN